MEITISTTFEWKTTKKRWIWDLSARSTAVRGWKPIDLYPELTCLWGLVGGPLGNPYPTGCGIPVSDTSSVYKIWDLIKKTQKAQTERAIMEVFFSSNFKILAEIRCMLCWFGFFIEAGKGLPRQRQGGTGTGLSALGWGFLPRSKWSKRAVSWAGRRLLLTHKSSIQKERSTFKCKSTLTLLSKNILLDKRTKKWSA